MPTRTAAPRPRLDRVRVLRAGIEFADENGIDALSMRALATELGVVPMALYKHVSDKDDLIGGMIDAVVSGYAAPPAGAAWRERIRARVLAARSAILAHPWLRSAIESRRRPSAAVLAHMDAAAGDLISGGLSVDLAHYAMHALGSRIWGFSPEAFPESAADPEQAAASPEERAAMMRAAAERFPSITAIALDAAERNPSGACDEQVEFEFTLDLLLDAFARLHAAGWRSRG